MHANLDPASASMGETPRGIGSIASTDTRSPRENERKNDRADTERVRVADARSADTPGRTRTCDRRLRRPMLYPAELQARERRRRLGFNDSVGATGFEPATYGSQNRRATRLRYAPEPRGLARATSWRKRYRPIEVAPITRVSARSASPR